MKSMYLNEKGYELVFVPFIGGEDYKRVYLYKDSLEDIDRFTSEFADLNDMIVQLNAVFDENLVVDRAYVYSIADKQCLPVLYKDDRFDKKTVISQYKKYVFWHRNFQHFLDVAESLGIKREDFSSRPEMLEICLSQYFENLNYVSVRDAYFALKGLGKKEFMVGVNRFEEDETDTFNEEDYFNQLMDKGDYDDIHKIWSSEEIEKFKRRRLSRDRKLEQQRERFVSGIN